MLLKTITVLSAVLAIALAAAFRIPWLLFSFGAFWLLGAMLALGWLWLICSKVDMSQEQTEDDPFYRKWMYIYIEVLIQLLQVRVKPVGLEKTPKDTRFLLVCNHQFVADPVILHHFFRKSQLAFISKKENDGLFAIGPLMHKTLCQSIDREDDRQALQVILKCIRILKADQASICVFPEGGTNHDDKLHPFRPGVFKIAQKAGVPIVVCTLRNTRPIIQNGIRLKPTDVELRLLDVIPPENLKGRTAVDISHEVFRMMAADLGPEMVAARETEE